MLKNKSFRILYIASDSWFFASHFLHVAKAARQAGFTVGIAAQFESMGGLPDIDSTFYPLAFQRKHRSFRAVMQGLPSLIKAVKEFRPDLVHIIGLQNILAAAPALALLTQVKFVLAPIGLGRFWIENTATAVCARFLIKETMRLLQGNRFFYLFENDEDSTDLGLKHYRRARIVGGAGVDENIFLPSPFPSFPPLKAALVSRMLHSKGVIQAVTAIRQVRRSGVNIELDLWGEPDSANATSLTEGELQALNGDGVRWRRKTDNVVQVWQQAHLAVLLSAREGLPKSLLEAAASGRPILATNVPGCRTLVRNGIEGLLVPFDDLQATIQALICLAEDASLREKLGAAARARILDGFTQRQVQDAILDIYHLALKS